MSLPPLPPQWDRDRVYSTNEINLVDLPAADRELIAAWRKADGELSTARLRATVAEYTDATNASRIAAGLPTIEEAERAIAEEMGIADFDMAVQGGLFDVANSMHKMGFEAWGFVVFKTWGYKEGERERWNAFWRRWNEIMDRRLRSMGAVGDLREGFNEKLLWLLVDHETMDGKGFKEVRECFAGLVEEAEEHVPLGLDLDLCLMIDKESVDSLLDRDETLLELLSPEEEKAIVWGVDVNYDDDDEEGGGSGDNEYPGYFKISMSILIPELWNTLNILSPYELYRGKGKVYGGVTGDVAEEIAEGTLP